jgi:uncharacterized protein YdeI (BOF family)
MKKILILIFLGIYGFTTGSYAAYTGPNKNKASSVREMRTNPVDDAGFNLKGYISQRNPNGSYEFTEIETYETITLDIDHSDFPEEEDISDRTLVMIHGEVDKSSFTGAEYDVKRIVVQRAPVDKETK